MGWQDEYENVEDRLVKFWKDYPNGRIETEPTYTSDDAKVIVIRALVYKDIDDVNPVATGIAEETKGQGNAYVNNTSWVENCETSAIGRALANWMYQGSGKKRPSMQEMAKTQKFKDDKVKVEKVDMRKKENKPTEEEKAKMEKIADEMVKPSSTVKADQLKKVMEGMVTDETKMKDFQAQAYSYVVSDLGYSESVEDWQEDDMSRFLDEFEKLSEGWDKKGSIDNVSEVFEVEEKKGGDEEMSDEWKDNPASEKQMKWVNDIVQKATDQNIEGLEDLKKLYGDGNITGGTASDIINNWNDKV